MTIKEAIQILDDGEWWDAMRGWYWSVHPERGKLTDAVKLAIIALKEKQERENNES